MWGGAARSAGRLPEPPSTTTTEPVNENETKLGAILGPAPLAAIEDQPEHTLAATDRQIRDALPELLARIGAADGST